jgi:CHAD domain-containing protein
MVPVRRALAARHAALGEDDLGQRIAAFCADLEAVRARVPSWPATSEPDSLARGLKRTYRRAREAMDAAYNDPASERFHDWRKRVKYHRYHLELLAAVWPRQVESRRKEVKALGEMLGDEHDLAVLEATLAADRESFSEAGAQLVSELAQRRRAELRAAMQPLGQRLFAERPKALARRYAAYWQAARSTAEDGGAREAA